MKKKICSLVLVMVLLLTACGSADKEDATSKPEKEETTADATSADEPEETSDGSWAIYWYMCGSDLESEDGSGTEDIGEAAEVELPDNVQVVLQTGGASEWQNTIVDADTIGRYEVKDGSLEPVEELEQANMGDEETLKDFLNFCNENYPADHKMVVFWDHGGGSASGAISDENYDDDSLTLPELRSAFEATCETSTENPPYDIIGFDACLMATVDVANIFKDVGKYLVASEETEPGLGWSYDGWLGELAKNTAITPADLGKAICDTFYSACEEVEIEDDVTLSVTDLSKLDPVLEAYNALGDEALVAMIKDDSFPGKFARASRKTENYGSNTKRIGFSDMADMGDLAEHTKELLPNSVQAVQDAIADAVVYQVKGTYTSHASGLSCFVHYSHDEEKLANYINGSATEAFDYYYMFNLIGELDDDGYNYISKLLDGGKVEAREPFDISQLEDIKLTIENGNTAVLNVGTDASSLSSVCYDLYTTFDNGESFVCLGSAATPDDVDADWENGVFKDNFRGVWGAIDDNFVYMDVVSTGEDYTMYQIPIKLNGKEMYLSVACDQETHEFTILGAQSEMENGVAAKDLRKLKAGDKIIPILYAITEDEVLPFETDAFTVSEDTSFEEVELGDGKYALDFEMTGIDGKTATSDIEIFRVKKGVMEYL